MVFVYPNCVDIGVTAPLPRVILFEPPSVKPLLHFKPPVLPYTFIGVVVPPILIVDTALAPVPIDIAPLLPIAVPIFNVPSEYGLTFKVLLVGESKL